MKNRIWKSCKTLGISLVITVMLLTGNVVQGAETEKNDVLESDIMGVEVFQEDEEMAESDECLVTEEDSESIETPDVAEIPGSVEAVAGIDEPAFSDQEEKEIKPGYKMWITPEQEQIKAGRELLYTVLLENTGTCQLRNIQLLASFSNPDLKGVWEEKEGAETQDGTLKFDAWEPGVKKEFYFSVQIPEEQSGKIELCLKGSADYEEAETDELRTLALEEKRETEILPLKADFQVTKTADRTMAVPGDKVIFQICIRNTGERTLHSVITTEKFQMENVPVRFLEAEGIVLDKSRTKAKIEKIEPGSAVGIMAEVTLPEKLEDQKLVNEVIVTTLETGERKVTSKAELQVYKAAETPIAETGDFSDGKATQNTEPQSQKVSAHPKTGDAMKPELWFLLISGSLLAAGWTCSRLR